ncbi:MULTISPECIES: hypothetical protein [unclassified Neorhizobium]|uniref:hypothetical protein n=1 Tax=unclassified Neorhizobium TaxID=2629175 RepID=UPI001FF56094|nr:MULTISPECIES: hypothetical protein [unclassified Neorhizobium]MCJ9668792.1 hypothetical protein [Neorhizobium sp. SHOUNA12B]MCJ9744598.1 hypothetical protein [Neorhizobium sp. SHOUNA12A]
MADVLLRAVGTPKIDIFSSAEAVFDSLAFMPVLSDLSKIHLILKAFCWRIDPARRQDDAPAKVVPVTRRLRWKFAEDTLHFLIELDDSDSCMEVPLPQGRPSGYPHCGEGSTCFHTARRALRAAPTAPFSDINRRPLSDRGSRLLIGLTWCFA